MLLGAGEAMVDKYLQCVMKWKTCGEVKACGQM